MLYYENWWKETVHLLGEMFMSNPTCSARPNAGKSINMKISDQEFFQTRNISIPVKQRRKGIRVNEYEHLITEPIWRIMLECDCERPNDINGNDICTNQKTVNLSKGVGGDQSFFIHSLNPSGSYKVVAHICLSLIHI